MGTKTASVTIRISSNINSVFVDGREFDRSTMSRAEMDTVRRIIRAWRFPKEAA